MPRCELICVAQCVPPKTAEENIRRFLFVGPWCLILLPLNLQRIVMPSPLRFGILGAANIARGFVPPLKHSATVRIDAIASRTQESAEAFGREFDIPKRYASYEALLADSDIDAVYIPLPNNMHHTWTRAAIDAGKHVLCEKPLALNTTEAREMFSAADARGVALLEAFPYMFQPQTELAMSLVRDGRIGAVQYVQAAFGFNIADPANIRFDPAMGGGALLDAGCYAVSFVRLMMGAAPARVTAHARWTARGVDESLLATLIHDDGRDAQIACTIASGVHRRALVAGTGGTIETDFLNSTSDDAPGSLLLREGVSWGLPQQPQTYARGSGFAFEAEAFARYIAEGDRAALKRWEQISVDNARTLDALIVSARDGRVIELAA
jgi:predicted dehydrogenase